MLTALASALTTVATSPYALVGYVVLVGVWGYLIAEGSRLRRLISVIHQPIYSVVRSVRPRSSGRPSSWARGDPQWPLYVQLQPAGTRKQLGDGRSFWRRGGISRLVLLVQTCWFRTREESSDPSTFVISAASWSCW